MTMIGKQDAGMSMQGSDRGGELLILKVLFVVISYTISDESKNDWKAGREYEYAGREQRVAVGEWSIHG